MSFNRKTARKQAGKQPCVVIDRDPDGNDFVYADSGVVDFSRSAHIREDPLYRYTPLPIPDGWLNQPAWFLGDGSEAERRTYHRRRSRRAQKARQSEVSLIA